MGQSLPRSGLDLAALPGALGCEELSPASLQRNRGEATVRKTRIGVPRGLFFDQYLPLMKTFFELLGAEVVISPPTTHGVVARGSARLVAETCLPVKVYVGHIMELRGECDWVFVPAVRSLAPKVTNCSKFLGLPDLVKATVPGCPPILAADVDLSQGTGRLWKEVYRLAAQLSAGKREAKAAAEAAWQAQQEYDALVRREWLTPPEALQRIFGLAERSRGEEYHRASSPREPGLRPITLAVVGHPYIVHDPFVTHNLFRRLRSLGARVVTAEMAAPADIEAGIAKLVGKRYWTFEGELVGASGHYLDGEADGVIAVVVFGCGPDSTMLEVVQRYAKQRGAKLLMTLVLDEHTAEAGLVTRLEAFVDTIRRRKEARG